MKLRTRRIIMFAFILTFFILAPILIFYASGYRYDLKRQKILKTGTLMLESKNQKKAEVYINNVLYEKPLNEKIYIYNLLPGDYQLRLAKEGYFSWQKKITINSGITTFAQNIILFKNEVPLQIVDGQVGDFSFSPDGQKFIYLIANDPFSELYIYDLLTNEKNLIYRTSLQKEIGIEWAASSKKFLVKFNNNYLVFDQQNLKQAIDLSDLLGLTPDQVKWDLKNDNLLFAQAQNTLYTIDIFDKKTQQLFNLPKKQLNPEFFIEANDIFYIQMEDSQNILYKYNQIFKTTLKILELPKSNAYKFIKSTNNYIGLIDSDQNKLYLIKKTNTESEINIRLDEPVKQFEAKNAVWDSQEKQLIIYDDFEINIYNTATNEKYFINRYGQIIKKIAWYPDLNHLVILFENSIQIIDLDQANNERSIIDLVKFDSLNNFYLETKGEKIYLSGKIGKQQGFYQVNLR